MPLRVLSMILAMFLAASVCAAEPAAVVPPVQAFFSYPQISDVQISPDGKYLAMVAASDKTGADHKTLIVMRADDHKVTANFQTRLRQKIYEYWWANDERLLIATATQPGSLDEPVPDGQLFGINVDGSAVKLLMGYFPSGQSEFSHITRNDQPLVFQSLLYIPPNDAQNVVVQAYTGANKPEQAYSLNIYYGTLFNPAYFSSAANGDMLTDNNGDVRLALGNNIKTGVEKFFYRPAGASGWRNLSTLYQNGDPAFTSSRPVGFAADNKTIYWLGRTPSSTLGLYALDPDTLKTTLLYGDPDYDINQVITSFDWQKTQHIVAVMTMPGYPALHILDNKSAEARDLALLYATFPNDIVDITSNTRDESEMIVYVHSDQNPGAYYLFDARNKTANLLFNSLPGIDSKKMARMRPVTFKARDGVTLHGYLTLPPGSSDKNLPLIINPHGGPHGLRDEWGWDPEAQFFASRGYAWLQVNYRGSGGYGMKFQDMGYRHWGTTMQSDLADAVHWAITQGIADPKRICIYGASYGGYAALENSILFPKLYQCTVGYAGVYDLTTLENSDFAIRYAFGDRYLDVVLGDDESALKAESPVYQVDKIQDPVFIVYGGADTRAKPKNDIELIAALKQTGKKYQVMYEPDEWHGYAEPEHRFALYTRMLAFFDKYIGPGAIAH
ncbi:MAG: alpha/beta hydrolase family protein [Gammaproteobacteria bacterium]